MEEDRRTHRRWALRVPVLVYSGPDRECTRASLFDISRGGAYFAMPSAPAHGAHVFFRLTTATGVFFEATGYVRRTMRFAGGVGVAAQFGHTSAPFLEFLKTVNAAPEVIRAGLFAQITGFEIFIG
jgi:hypothetical protein